MVSVAKIDDKNIRVNGKLVYRDMDGNWVSKMELSRIEIEALNHHTKKE